MTSSIEQISSIKTLKILLSETLSPNDQTSKAAERKLRGLMGRDQFVLDLTEILIDSDTQLAVRELASVHIRKYAETHLLSWGRSFQPSPRMNSKSKKRFKRSLLLGLRESNNKIRKMIAKTVSTIAYTEWTSSWPSLFDILLEYLGEEDEFTVDGALQVLYNSSQLFSNNQSAIVDPRILSEIYRIFIDHIQYSMRVRGRAVQVFTNIVKLCGSSGSDECLHLVIPMFCEKFIQILSENDLSNDSCGLKTTVVEAIAALTKTKTKSKFIMKLSYQMLSLIWKTLIDIAKIYQADTVIESTDITNRETASEDGEIINDSENLVQAIVRFIYILIAFSPLEYNTSDYHWFHLLNSLSPELFYHLIIFMKITDSQIEQWSNDPEKFYEEEAFLCYPNGLRGEVSEPVLGEILECPPQAAANTLVIVILKQMEIETMMRASNNCTVIQNRWKFHEAFLLAFCLAKDVIVEKQNEGTLHFDIVAFLENVILVDLNDSESHPLLIARCLRLGGLYAEQMPLEMVTKFLQATTNGLKNQSVCTKICAALAAKCWFRVASIDKNEGCREKLRSHLPALFQGLYDLGMESISSNIIDIVMDSLDQLLSSQFHTTFITSVLRKIHTLAVTTFLQPGTSCQSHRVCVKFFKELTLNPKYAESLQAVLVPRLVGGSHIEATEILVQHSPQPLSNLMIETLFPALCKYISSMHVKPQCQRYLKCHGDVVYIYLSVAHQQVIGYRDEHGKTGQQYILQVATELLDEKSCSSEALVACEIVTLLIKKAGDMLGVDVSEMQKLLAAMLNRMITMENDSTLHRRLLMAWAHLINTQTHLVLNLLSTIHGSVGQRGNVSEEDALSFVIFQGFCREYAGLESDERKTVTQAFCKILVHSMTHPESRLHFIFVKGTEDSGTAAIPLLVQICKLITNDLTREVEELNNDQGFEEEIY